MTHKKIRKVLYIGDYNRNYPRNYNFINGLKQHNVVVDEINTINYGKKRIIFYFLKNFTKLIRQNYDLIIFYSLKVSLSFVFGRIIAYIKNVPFIHDIFISKLLTYYYDYELREKRRIIPKFIYYYYYYLNDFIQCNFSSYVILDTNSHIKYFVDNFKIPLKKFRTVYIGTREDIFNPPNIKKERREKIIIGFWGGFIPLQGIEYIIRAIKLLEKEPDLAFFFLGNGVTYNENIKLAKDLQLKNVEFMDFVPIEQVRNIIIKADIGLGIFGDKPKTKIVIPNKIYDGIAIKVPMITAETPAIQELFRNDENISLCKVADPQSLAESILKLKNDRDLMIKISENAYELCQKYCTTNKIGERLIQLFKTIH